jgi:hypothetical protein
MSWVPVTPGGSVLMHLERDTEEEAWEALMQEAAHIHYRNQQEFEERGYEVNEAIDFPENS